MQVAVRANPARNRLVDALHHTVGHEGVAFLADGGREAVEENRLGRVMVERGVRGFRAVRVPVVLHEERVAGRNGGMVVLGVVHEEICVVLRLRQPLGHAVVLRRVHDSEPKVGVEAGVVVARLDAVVVFEPCAARTRGDKAKLVLLAAHDVEHGNTEHPARAVLRYAHYLAGDVGAGEGVKVVVAERVVFGRRGIVVAVKAPAVVVGEAVVLPVGERVAVVPVEQQLFGRQCERVAERAGRDRAAFHRKGEAVAGFRHFERAVRAGEIFNHAGAPVAVGEGRDDDAVAAVRADEVHSLGVGAGAKRRFAPFVRLAVVGAQRAASSDGQHLGLVRARLALGEKTVGADGGVLRVFIDTDVLREVRIFRPVFRVRHVARRGVDDLGARFLRHKIAEKQLRQQKKRQQRQAEKACAELSKKNGLFQSVHGNHLSVL